MQRELERKAAIMGGGNFTVPVQRVTDFIGRKTSGSLWFGSYININCSCLHELKMRTGTILTLNYHVLSDRYPIIELSTWSESS